MTKYVCSKLPYRSDTRSATYIRNFNLIELRDNLGTSFWNDLDM